MTEAEESAALPQPAVLVVDDMPQNLLAMSALLREEAVEVVCAASAREALELLLCREFAFALLDVQMPETDGVALAELMRGNRRTREIPIVFVTAGSVDDQHSFRGYEAGAVDYLHKPIDSHVLRSKVGVFAQLFRQRQLLAARNRRLQQVLELQETMLSVLTHDLRSPLSAVMTCAELLRRRQEAGVQQLGDRLRRSGTRMVTLVDQLLDFSRLRSGSLELGVAALDLDAVVRGVVAECREAQPLATIRVRALGDTRLDGDEARLGQVLANLLGNAVQHGDGEADLTLDGTDAERLCVVVRNRGRIEPALLPRLFEPYKGSGGGGLGLGLYIVDQFVRAHGGRVDLRHDEAHVEFRVELPRRAPTAVAAASASVTPRSDRVLKHHDPSL